MPHAALALLHAGRPLAPHDLTGAWPIDPGVLLPLVMAAVLYAAGLGRLRARAGPQAYRVEAWCYAAGWGALAAALASPLHPLGSVLFSAHMAQHEVVMVLAAPLLVLGRPVVPFLFALPIGWRRRIGAWARNPRWSAGWGRLTEPLAAWVIHALAILVWHLPVLYGATLRSDAAHGLQHASFVGTALLFWWSLLQRGARARPGAAVLYLFLMALYTGGLGALITLSETPWYAAYGAAAPAWGLTSLQDQQLAGLIMWMPGGLAYLVAALALVAGWLRRGELKARPLGAVASAGAMLLVVAVGGCGIDRESADRTAARLTGGDPARGPAAFRAYGCQACHTLGGVPGADAVVGPPLDGLAARAYIAGVLPNNGENLVRWIRDPQGVDGKTAMPDVGVSERDARDIAAYIYTRR